VSKHVLITGGAGFIGSHLADELLSHGYRVRVLDNLSPQVHGDNAKRPTYLHSDIELCIGDVRDPDAVARALHGIDAVYHFAAIVGVGQSMYEIAEYTHINNVGTAVLLEALLKRSKDDQPVEKLIVASSMSIYGEGLYHAADGSTRTVPDRTLEQLRAGIWEHADSDGNPLLPLPTPESKTPALPNIYALSKYDQERMSLIFGRAYSIPTVALRFFNAYGTRQALSNPYTGVLAIFGSRLLNNHSPLIYEDGNQKRDFVSVYDVAQACRLALEVPEAAGQVFNIGSGMQYTVREVAEKMARALGKEHIAPEITGKYRVGDVRHCFADISRACDVLGYRPRITLEQGMVELSEWLAAQDENSAQDRVEQAVAELATRGLTI
jgi:dTDP-L-rhamnose 4-epimerase